MNNKFTTKLYWFVPAFMIVLAIFLLFYENFSDVTEPPADDWSRALTVGETNLNHLPPVKVTENGDFVFTRFEDGKLATTTLSKDFTVKEEQTYNIPVNKWTQVYQQKDTILYFDFKNIYDQEKNMIVSDVEKFYPLETTTLYVKGHVLYQLSPGTKNSEKIMDIDLDKLKLKAKENKNGVSILTYSSHPTGVDITLQQHANGKINTIYQSSLKVDPGKVVNDISFALNGQKLALFLQEELQSTQGGNPEFFNYFMLTSLSSPNTQTLNELTLEDPAGNNSLKEVSDVILTFRNDKPTILFHANGRTQTQFNDSTTFNIYSAEINESGTTKTERRSNTPEISTNPQWINEKTIAWIDLDGDSYKIKLSSADIKSVNPLIEYTQDDWLQALGKTFGMITSSFFGIAFAVIWFIWPLLFVVFMYIFRNRIADRDPIWYFYTGIGLYAIASLIWKDRFFVDNIYTNAPSYLTFTGSSYLYMILFAIIALWLTIHSKKVNHWAGTVRISYFVGLHILLLTIFFGPYII
ncbi:hypothetical protein P9D43_21855 [Neobacillus niacini]|uniref:hypothetical protein n=1 Tax=Neobacillus niacini TaxID=86668 RepID=UPI0007ABFCDE|nr:hypothetical protein [Neobacillus niacini]MEC1524653.1 hypothetical protein [Neobacillus niacini]